MGKWLGGARGTHSGGVLDGTRPAEPVIQLPREGWERPPLVVAGAHGGSGASTLALFLGEDAEDVGGAPGAAVGHRPVVVTALGTAYGARRAIERAAEMRTASSGVVVAITGDGPWPAPVAVRARLRALEAEVLAVVRVPYVTRWRFLDTPEAPPDRYLKAVRQIRSALAGSQSSIITNGRA